MVFHDWFRQLIWSMLFKALWIRALQWQSIACCVLITIFILCGQHWASQAPKWTTHNNIIISVILTASRFYQFYQSRICGSVNPYSNQFFHFEDPITSFLQIYYEARCTWTQAAPSNLTTYEQPFQETRWKETLRS